MSYTTRKSKATKVTVKDEVKKINVKPLVPLQRLNSNKDKSLSISMIGSSPTEKSKPGSIHDILEQMTVDPKSKEARAGKLAADRWKDRSVRQIYDDFCQETSFSALTRIHKASHWYKRIIWVTACLCMMSWLTVQCVWLFQKYFRYPVEVQIEVVAVPNIEFPSITICNINPLRASMTTGPFDAIMDSLQLDDTDMLYDDYLSEMKSGWETTGTSETNATHSDNSSYPTFEEYDYTFWHDQLKQRSFNKWDALENDTQIAERFYSEMDDGLKASFAYSGVAATLSIDQLKPHGHQKEDLIISCTWQGMACSPKNFTYLRNNVYGNCYTLNAFDNGKTALSTNYAGPLMGLVLEMNIEQGEYVPSISPDAGVKMVIHKPGTYPIPEDEGLSLPPGFKTSIGLDRRDITRLPPPHADCGYSGVGVVNLYTEQFGTEYTKSTCLKSCLQTSMLETCGCASSFFYVPPNSSVCCFDNVTSACVHSTTIGILESCNDRCPSPCIDTNYDFTMSMSQWPSEKYQSHLFSKISKSSSDFMDKASQENSESTLVKVEVYYKELMKETVEQQKAYESENLISDIGGQLGLWLGLSAITIGELIEFFASLVRVIATKCCGKKAKGRGKEAEAGLSQVAPLTA